jgi:hypothetical protein
MLLAAAFLGSAAAAQDGPAITTSPARPRPGTLFELRLVSRGADQSITGDVAGEPLHFVRDGAQWRAWAAAPVDSAGSLVVRLSRCRSAAGCDSLRHTVPLATATYRVDQLRVAPRFGQPPDSTTATRIAREFAEARAVSRGAHETPQLWGGAFARPRSARITSGFGNAREFNGTVTSRHTGVDFAGAIGAPVRAAERGVVRLVGDFFYAGRVVYVDHGAGFVTAYFHLSRARVVVGDTVARGQVIGAVGASGRVTGPHLHFVARYGEVSVDGLTLPGIGSP